jgi:Tfp pilus assembly protein PilO
MKALYSGGQQVPLKRVLQEHRRALIPLALLLGINIVALFVVVLPQSQRVAAAEERAAAAERERVRAQADLNQAESLGAAKNKATADLARFYEEVLPANVSEARRILGLKLRQLAAAHGVEYASGATTEEEIDGSTLLRLTQSMALAGTYDNIRDFIFAIETSPEFVVIEDLRLAETASGSELQVTLTVTTYYRRAPADVVQTGRDGR